MASEHRQCQKPTRELGGMFQRLPSISVLLSVLASVVGAGGSIGYLFLSNPYIAVYPPALFIAGCLSLYLLNTNKPSKIESLVPKSYRPYLIAAFALSFVGTSIAYLGASYDRSLLVYGFTILAYVSGLLIALANSRPFIQIAPILSTGVLHRFTVFYGGPLVLGNDSIWHTRIAGEVAVSGSLAPLALEESKYFLTSFYHILVATGSMIMDISPRHTSFLVITVPFVIIPALIIYSFIRRVYTPITAVFGMFLFVTVDVSVFWSVLPQATTLGAIFGSLTIICAFRSMRSDCITLQVLTVGFFGAIVFTHHASAFIIAFLITAAYGLSAVTERRVSVT